MTLEQALSQIKGADRQAEQEALDRWASVAKPLGSLGLLEENVTRIAALTGDAGYTIEKRAVTVLCADNGVAAQGVTQTGQEITALVAKNLTVGKSCVCHMARLAGCDVIPVDIGVAVDVDAPGLWNRKIAYGTADLSREPAMSREQAEQAVLTGIELVQQLKEAGYKIIATGEMGIGNTTTAAAVSAALLGLSARQATGRGAGLSTPGLERKIQVVAGALALHKPDPRDPLDVLSKAGGFDIAGMAGLFLGGALYRVPVIVDGLISAAAALCAARMNPDSRCAMIASHVSAEPAGPLLLEALGLKPMITAGMRMGEGTGAVAALPLLDMGFDIYHRMQNFEEIGMDAYVPQQ